MTVYKGICVINIRLMIQRCLLVLCKDSFSGVGGFWTCIMYFFLLTGYTQVHCIWKRVCLTKDLEYVFAHLKITIKVEIEDVHMFSFIEIPIFFSTL